MLDQKLRLGLSRLYVRPLYVVMVEVRLLHRRLLHRRCEQLIHDTLRLGGLRLLGLNLVDLRLLSGWLCCHGMPRFSVGMLPSHRRLLEMLTLRRTNGRRREGVRLLILHLRHCKHWRRRPRCMLGCRRLM